MDLWWSTSLDLKDACRVWPKTAKIQKVHQRPFFNNNPIKIKSFLTNFGEWNSFQIIATSFCNLQASHAGQNMISVTVI